MMPRRENRCHGSCEGTEGGHRGPVVPVMSAPPTLVGRAAERRRLENLLHEAHTGQSGVLVLRGGRGLGKSSLLDHAARHAGGCLVVRLRGTESERDLPYAAVHMLCTALGGLERLPRHHRHALESAIGSAPEPTADRFLIGVAVLGLLTDVARTQPVACIVDDTQWLDRPSAQALAFAARRLEAARVTMIFAEHGPTSATELEGLPELALDGLTREDAGSVVASALPGRMDPAAVERIIAEARGNPRALLESVAGLSTAELAGGYGVPVAHRPPCAVDAELRTRVGSLAPDSRALLLAIAAEPTGDLALLWRMAELSGVSPDRVEALHDAGLLRFTTIATFRDPALRTWLYSAACPEKRNDAHRLVAVATDPLAYPDRRAWHTAHAVEAPDAAAADELTRQAGRARERGGPGAAAAFLRRAASLTADPVLRARRSLAAAAATYDAGSGERALRLLGSAEQSALDEPVRAQSAWLRARIRFAAARDRDAARSLLRATHAAAGVSPPSAAGRMCLEAVSAVILADGARGSLEAAEATSRVLRALGPQPPNAFDVLLDGLITRCRDGYGAAVEPLVRGLKEFRRSSEGTETRAEAIPPCWPASLVAADLWDDTAWNAITGTSVRLHRDAGALPSALYALDQRAVFLAHTGDLQGAENLADEAAAIANAIGHPVLSQATFMLDALRGKEIRTARPALDNDYQDAADCAEAFTAAAAAVAAAVLHNGMRRHGEALAAARRVGETDVPALTNWALVEVVEAAALSGAQGAATAALDRLAERTRRCGGEWALGVEARSRALLAVGPTAEEHYAESIDLLGRTRMRFHLARSLLLYGRWLRLEGRRAQARVQLRNAHEAFSAMGAEGFARGAHRELLATGERTRDPGRGTAPAVLTPQESRIALFARDGLTNTEIGRELSVSPRTVEYHLHKVFTKLGVASRNELHLVLDSTRTRAERRVW